MGRTAGSPWAPPRALGLRRLEFVADYHPIGKAIPLIQSLRGPHMEGCWDSFTVFHLYRGLPPLIKGAASDKNACFVLAETGSSAGL